MKPSEVPAELVEILGEQMFEDAHEHCDSEGCTGGGKPYYVEYARDLLAVVLPAYREQLVRQATGMVVHGPAGVGIHCETCGRSQLAASDDVDASFALATILGHATSPEHTAQTARGAQ